MKKAFAKSINFLSIAFALVLASRACLGSGLNDSKPKAANNTVSVDRLKSTPDLMQSLPAASLPYDGQAYCGPVAVSNSLVWLSHQGYPKLGLLGGADTPSTQGRMARFLGYCMRTGSGTTAENLLLGVEQYVTERGYRIESLKYQGWEAHDEKYGKGTVLPELNWIKSGLNGPSATWLTIGFYNYSAKTDEYVPFSQHWVTLAGFGQDKNGKKDPNILIIHDPASRSGTAASDDFVRLERITHGNFSRDSERTDLHANGYYKMTGDLKMKKGANIAILEGAVILKLKKEI